MINKKIDGTTSQSFQISLKGPTFSHGDQNPTVDNGSTGDIFLLNGVDVALLQKQSSGWKRAGSPFFGFVRETVNAGWQINVSNATTYVGVIGSSAEQTVVMLPEAYPDKTIVIKNESGQVNTIKVTSNSVTIDGQNQVYLSNAASAISLLRGESEWTVMYKYT